MTTPDTQDGIHQHIDGGFYRALGVARASHAPWASLVARTGLPAGAQLIAKVRHSEDQSLVLVYSMPNETGMLYRFERPNVLIELGDLMVYEHLWPFEVSVWGRPLVEFEKRFKPVAYADLVLAMEHDRVTTQAAISTARSARRRQNPSPQALAAAPGHVEAMLRTVEDPDVPVR